MTNTTTEDQAQENSFGFMLKEAMARKQEEAVNHPPHYLQHPSQVECIQITEHMNFCLGNAVKYIWRAGLKSDAAVQDLKKAKWYIEREIARLESK
jgi:hypothetical protein